MTTIQFRIDPTIKKKVYKVLDAVGIDVSTAMNLFVRQVVLHGGIPFPILTKRGHALAAKIRKVRNMKRSL